MFSPRNCKASTHLMYADDIIVFVKVTLLHLRISLMELFQEYGTCQGKVVSRPKSHVFYWQGVQHRSNEIRALLGNPIGEAPFTYLEVPIFRGKP